MEIRQLALFVAAAEEQNFTLAAKRENIVQSGLSVAIRALEDDLGALLFIRNKRRVQLSEAGRIFLPEARRILQAVRMARNAVSDSKRSIVGRLAIGTVQSALSFLDLPALLQSFRKAHPGVNVTVHETYPQDIAQSLGKGLLDLAFMPLYGVATERLETVELFSSDMVLAVAQDHPLADRQSVSLAELADEPFIEFSARWSTRGLVDQIFLKEDVARKVICEVENFDLLGQLVMRGFGVSILPRRMVQQPGLRAVTIAPGLAGGCIQEWQIGIVRAKNSRALSLNPAAEVFEAMLETHANDQAGSDDLA